MQQNNAALIYDLNTMKGTVESYLKKNSLAIQNSTVPSLSLQKRKLFWATLNHETWWQLRISISIDNTVINYTGFWNLHPLLFSTNLNIQIWNHFWFCIWYVQNGLFIRHRLNANYY